MLKSSIAGGLALVALATIATPLWANPSTAQPDMPLAIRNEVPSRKLLELLVPIDRRAVVLIDGLDANFSSGNLGSSDFAAAGEAAVALFYLQVYGQQLGERGEAAGFDFVRRASSYDQRLRKVVAQLKKSTQFRLDAIEQLLKQVQSSNQPRLPGLTQQVARGELESVEQELLRILAEFARHSIWMENSGQYSASFMRLQDKVREPLLLARSTSLAADLAASIAKEEPGDEELLKLIDTAAADLQRSGHAPWRGESRTGPELIEHVLADWQQTHQRALRRRALELIRRGIDASAVQPAVQIQAVDAEFAGKLRSALADLIEADAARVASSGASQLYQDYVQALSKPLLVSDRAALVSVVQPVLSKLAAKDPILEVEVRAYADATSELLRWRRRIAQARGQHLQQTAFPDLNGRFAAGVRSRLNDPALLLDKVPTHFAALLGPAPNIMRRLRTELLGQPCTAGDVVGLGGGKAVGRYGARTYTRLNMPISLRQQAEVAALRKSLLVTDEYPPLSLDAATVLAGAEQDCYVRVGGTVQEVYLEPLLTRFATLPDRSTGLTPPDKIPDEPQGTDLRAHVLARCDLAPRWVQHECFVVMLEVPVLVPWAASD